MQLSIVTTLYESSVHLLEFHSRAFEAAAQLAGKDFELILVNDGSPDDSLEVAIRLSETDARIKVVDLSRNYGHHRAMFAGLHHATGDLVFLIDCDLEEDPAWLLDFSFLLQQEHADVVYGVQEKRKGGWFERITGGLFWRLLNLLSGLSLSPNQTTARLMSRRYVDALMRFEEKELFLHGVMHIVGFSQLPHRVSKLSSSQTTYSLGKRWHLFINSIVSFTVKPLTWIFYTGLAISLGAILMVFFLVFKKIVLGVQFEGWTSIMASVWLLGGLIISFVGIVGIYIAKIFQEVKGRPSTIERQIHQSGEAEYGQNDLEG